VDDDAYRVELEQFSGADAEAGGLLASKPRIAAANKVDALDDPDRLARLAAHLNALDVPLYPISAVTGEGVPALVEAMWRVVAEAAAPVDG
jgi:GTP-binding protein